MSTLPDLYERAIPVRERGSTAKVRAMTRLAAQHVAVARARLAAGGRPLLIEMESDRRVCLHRELRRRIGFDRRLGCRKVGDLEPDAAARARARRRSSTFWSRALPNETAPGEPVGMTWRHRRNPHAADRTRRGETAANGHHYDRTPPPRPISRDRAALAAWRYSRRSAAPRPASAGPSKFRQSSAR